jgi:hypothetical protein
MLGAMTTCQFCNVTHRSSVPTVHSNGTCALDLLQGLNASLDALRVAQRRMTEAAPNGRDYYLQGNQAMERAMGEHERRWTDLNRIMTELEEMRDHVQAVLDFQRQQRAQRNQEAR